MIYKITWRRKAHIYTEYLDIVALKHCLDFLENHDNYELISVVPNED